MRPRRDATGVLANIAVLERELGGVAYGLFRLGSAESHETAELRRRHAQLLQALVEENERLARVRAEQTDGDENAG